MARIEKIWTCGGTNRIVLRQQPADLTCSDSQLGDALSGIDSIRGYRVLGLELGEPMSCAPWARAVPDRDLDFNSAPLRGSKNRLRPRRSNLRDIGRRVTRSYRDRHGDRVAVFVSSGGNGEPPGALAEHRLLVLLRTT